MYGRCVVERYSMWMRARTECSRQLKWMLLYVKDDGPVNMNNNNDNHFIARIYLHKYLKLLRPLAQWETLCTYVCDGLGVWHARST